MDTSLSSTDIDFKLIPEFNCSSTDGVESNTSAAVLEATPFRDSAVGSESSQETFLPDGQVLVDSIHRTTESSSPDPSTEVYSSADIILQENTSSQEIPTSPDPDQPEMTVPTSPDPDQLPNQSIEGDIVLLRTNSQQYMDEMESARRTVALTQSGAFVGLALLTLLASWLLYQRFHRAA